MSERHSSDLEEPDSSPDYEFIGEPGPNPRFWLILSVVHLRGFWSRWSQAVVAVVPPLLVGTAALVILDGKASLESLGVIAGVAALAIGLRAAFRRGVIIAPIAMPKSLVDVGWTGEIASARIVDAAAGLTAGAADTPHPPYLLPPGDASARVEVPGFKLAPTAFGDLLRDLVNVRRVQAGGEIMQGSAPESALTLRLRFSPSSAWCEAGPRPATEVSRLIEDGAAALLTKLDPYTYGYALFLQGEHRRALTVAGAGADDPATSNSQRAQCEVLRWVLLRRFGESDQAIGASLARALHKDATHPMVALAVGDHLERRGAHPAGGAAWRSLAAAAAFWLTDRSVFSRHTLLDVRSVEGRREYDRSLALIQLRSARRGLLGVLAKRRQLENEILHPLTNPADMADTADRALLLLTLAEQKLQEARRLDPAVTNTRSFDRLSSCQRRLGAWLAAQTDPRLTEGRQALARLGEAAAVISIRVPEILRDGERQSKEILELYKPGGVVEARAAVRASIALAREIWPRDSPRVTGLALKHKLPLLAARLERNRKTCDRLASGLRRLPERGRFILRQAIRVNHRLQEWVVLKTEDDPLIATLNAPQPSDRPDSRPAS